MLNHLNGISRVDSSDTHGWLVRHYINGFTFSILFSDGKNKNKEKDRMCRPCGYGGFSIQIECCKDRKNEPDDRICSIF